MPWWVAGPLIGLFVPALLWFGNRSFGVSSSLRHTCAAVLPTRASFFDYDWRQAGGWNLAFVAGIMLGGVVAALVFGVPTPDLAPETVAALDAWGLGAPDGLFPEALFSWDALWGPGALFVIGGGFLVGFGARWAGGCTSGHAITGMANLQLPSLVAVLGFFGGGLFITHVIYPWLFG